VKSVNVLMNSLGDARLIAQAEIVDNTRHLTH